MLGNNKTYVGIAIIVLIAVVAYFLISNSAAPAVQPGQVSVPVSITDPPHVPDGTSALVIFYSSLQVHTVGQGSSQWVSSNASGMLNLMSLVNVTQTVAGVNLPANSTVDQIRFNISSATITINGTTSNVTVPNGEVSAQINGDQRFNSSSQVLVDLSPTVVPIFTANSTIFVLVPSVKAVITPSNNANVRVGERMSLNASDRNELAAENANISISDLSLSSNRNTTTFKLTVTNNGNRSVVIRHVLVRGVEAVNLSLNVSAEQNMPDHMNGSEDINVSSRMNASEHANVSARINASSHMNVSEHTNASEQINASSHMNASRNADVPGDTGLNLSMRNIEHFGALNFLIASNGTLSLPFTLEDVENNNGFTLASGSSQTFVFSGPIAFGEGHLSVSLVPGDNYTIYVMGEETASASANIIAS